MGLISGFLRRCLGAAPARPSAAECALCLPALVAYRGHTIAQEGGTLFVVWSDGSRSAACDHLADAMNLIDEVVERPVQNAESRG